MKIALAQMNTHLGDFSRNCNKILEMVDKAQSRAADLVVFPELSLFGYHPFDLMERSSVIADQDQALKALIDALPAKIYCLVGAVTANPAKGKPYLNSALLLSKGKIEKVFSKELLPVYDVFDDSRHFAAGRVQDNHFSLAGQKVQVLICEDMWGADSLHEHNPVDQLSADQIDLVINLSASPFTKDKPEQRIKHARITSEKLKAPLVYVNMVGGQDELIYDGGSFAIDSSGELVAQSPYCVEDVSVVDIDQSKKSINHSGSSPIERIHQALVVGLRDYIGKIGFKKAHIGLSGGIDSAVVACLIADAIGPENLTTIALPSRYNDPKSLELAEQLATNLGCDFKKLPIQQSFEQLVSDFEKAFGEREFSLMHENLQARLRGNFLMAFSNDANSMLINTSNKSEFATGFSTLYGDMCGGIAPIGDLLKHEVYELAHYYNRERELIPRFIIDRPPSAELREDQKDSDALPDYNVLDQSVERLVCQQAAPSNSTDEWVLRQLYNSEFKRWQAPPILKVSQHAFGRGRRMPIAHKARG